MLLMTRSMEARTVNLIVTTPSSILKHSFTFIHFNKHTYEVTSPANRTNSEKVFARAEVTLKTELFNLDKPNNTEPTPSNSSDGLEKKTLISNIHNFLRQLHRSMYKQ